MVTKLRLPPLLATLVSSGIFGWMHVGNEGGSGGNEGVRQKIYAAWTFAGGVVFGGAYLATGGNVIWPILLHFGLNTIIFADSARKVGIRALTERRAMRAMAERVRADPQQGRAGSQPTSPSAVEPTCEMT